MTVTNLLLLTSVLLLLRFYGGIKPRLRKVGPFLPDSFVFGVGLYAAGAFVISVAYADLAAATLATMSLIAMVSALSGAILFAHVGSSYYRTVSFSRQFQTAGPGPIEMRSIKVILILSGLVCIAFLVAVFSNSIVGALLSIASLTGESTLLDARKAITAGSDGYFAPGYVKQFRDILIPIALIATMSITTAYRRSPIVWFGFVSAILAMLVSGQRLVFVVFFVALLLGRYYARQGIGLTREMRVPRSSAPWITVLVLLVLYAALTILLGRTNPDLAPVALVFEIFINLADRVLLAAPRENYLTFDVWQALGPTYGEAWLADLGGVLPGVSESLANILHSATGGSLQGNSPLGLPADVWLAWGWGGLVVIPFCYAFAVGLLDMVLLGNRSPLLLATRLYLFVVLPICYSPYLFVLYGGAAALILILFAATLRSKSWWTVSTAAG